jgi:hypothetical protein
MILHNFSRPSELRDAPAIPAFREYGFWVTKKIFKVTAIWQTQSACRSKVFEQIAVAGKSVAVFWEIAEFSERSP